MSVLRTNAQKYLPNYFRKGQLEKLFFLFPVRFASHRAAFTYHAPHPLLPVLTSSLRNCC